VGILKRLLVVLPIAGVSLIACASAFAWHVNGVNISAECDTSTYTYVVNASIDQSNDWPGAYIKSVSPASFPGTASGTQTVTVVIGWPKSYEKQTVSKEINLSGDCKPPAPPPPPVTPPPAPNPCPYPPSGKDGQPGNDDCKPPTPVTPTTPVVPLETTCPTGTTKNDQLSKPGLLVCDHTVPGPERVVVNTVTKTVYGHPKCPSHFKMTKRGKGFVACTRTVVKNHVKTVVKVRVVKASKPAYTR
jgi:hypothetical protein